VPGHLIPHLTVTAYGKDLAQGGSAAALRREVAAAARAELDRQAHAEYESFGAWRRFELDVLPESVPLALESGTVLVYPTLAEGSQGLEVRYEWSAAEAARSWRHGAAKLARAMLSSHARDLGKAIAGNAPLLLAASPYTSSAAWVEALLHWAFRRACFGDAEAPRVREAFNQAVEQGRARLYPCLEEIAGVAMQWFTEARAVRRSIDDATLKGSAHVAEESRGHLQRLLNATTLQSLSDGWLRQLPRYLKAEERRWQRIAARGAEPPQIVRELDARSARYDSLAMQLAAELRWLPQLDELRGWMEEYRVSLYAQELKTLGPVSAARLEARAAEIEAWIAR
jgi:ATP-dependent helicase HrpA